MKTFTIHYTLTTISNGRMNTAFYQGYYSNEEEAVYSLLESLEDELIHRALIITSVSSK